MKLKVYIVTYKSKWLETTLNSIIESDIKKVFPDYELTVIANHPDLFVKDSLLCYAGARVLYNSTRPAWSTGHLARSWNECLLDGFRDPDNPDTDIVVTMQDDTVLNKHAFGVLYDMHTVGDSNFIQSGLGDNLCSYTIDALHVIGMWDERFNGIGCQEGDYLLRQLKYNINNSMINDYGHGRLWRPLLSSQIADKSNHHELNTQNAASRALFPQNQKTFKHKWGNMDWEAHWDLNKLDQIPNERVPNYIYYPYFELKLKCVKENPEKWI